MTSSALVRTVFWSVTRTCAAAQSGRGPKPAAMGHGDHVLLAATWRSDLSKEQAALTDPKRPAHPADRETGLLCVDDAEGIQFPSFATKSAAYVGMSPFAGKTALRIVF